MEEEAVNKTNLSKSQSRTTAHLPSLVSKPTLNCLTKMKLETVAAPEVNCMTQA